MIDCYVNVYNGNDECRIPLTDSGAYEVKENDKLVFHLIISEQELLTLGEPVMVIGDIPTTFLRNENSPQGSVILYHVNRLILIRHATSLTFSVRARLQYILVKQKGKL